MSTPILLRIVAPSFVTWIPALCGPCDTKTLSWCEEVRGRKHSDSRTINHNVCNFFLLHTCTHTAAHTHHSLGPQGGLDQITNGDGPHEGRLRKYDCNCNRKCIFLCLLMHKAGCTYKFKSQLGCNKSIHHQSPRSLLAVWVSKTYHSNYILVADFM